MGSVQLALQLGSRGSAHRQASVARHCHGSLQAWSRRLLVHVHCEWCLLHPPHLCTGMAKIRETKVRQG